MNRKLRNNPLFSFFQGHLSRIPSKPWLQPPGHCTRPSICLQSHRSAVGRYPCCKKVELVVTSGAKLYDHRSHTRSADTSFVFLVGGYPGRSRPNRPEVNVLEEFDRGGRIRTLASSITSTKAWASFMERYSNTSSSSRSEKMDFIKSRRSFVERPGLISRFHGGGSLDTTNTAELTSERLTT